MVDQRVEQTGLDRQRQLQHHLVVARHRVQILEDFLQQYLVGLGAFRALDVDFRLDDGNQASRQHLLPDLELLPDDGGNALAIGEVDDRTLLRAEHAQRSEEHTSELQSLMRISYAVFCLKKKKQKQQVS